MREQQPDLRTTGYLDRLPVGWGADPVSGPDGLNAFGALIDQPFRHDGGVSVADVPEAAGPRSPLPFATGAGRRKPRTAPLPLLTEQPVPALAVQLLSGFGIIVGSMPIDDSAWYLRKAKSLVKLLALAPRQRIHREQVMDILWPEQETEAAANNLHKALHAARRILEPDLVANGAASYLRLQHDYVTLILPEGSRIDVELFQTAAMTARLRQDPYIYEEALQLYAGDLLPEDRNEDWAVGPREELKALRLTLLLELADLHELWGGIDAAIETLRQVVASEPIHEDAHFKLMRLLLQAGRRHLALRQYRQLAGALKQELGAEPDRRAQSLYQQILKGESGEDARIEAAVPRSAAPSPPVALPLPPRTDQSPLVGRDAERKALHARLETLCLGRGGLVFVHGEAGSGKTRLAADLAAAAAMREVAVLWGGIQDQQSEVQYVPIAAALEGFARGVAAASPFAQLGDMAAKLATLRLAALGLEDGARAASTQAGLDRGRMFTAAMDFFKSLSARVPVLVVLDDLHAAGELSLRLIRYLAGATQDNPLLFVCAFRPADAGSESLLSRLVRDLEQGHLAERLDVPRLSFQATALLVGSLLGGPADQAVLDRVYELSHGNPHYAKEAVQALRGRDQIRKINGLWRLQRDTVELADPRSLRRRGIS